MEIEQFKHAVGKFPTGVCVITTSYRQKLWGFTANSFTSVSLNPALVSFCLDKMSGSIEAFRANDDIMINILSKKQEDISRHFATPHDNKFESVDYYISGNSKAPIINGCISVLGCNKIKEIECGDHFIFILEVRNTLIDDSLNPLLYYGKQYRHIV